MSNTAITINEKDLSLDGYFPKEYIMPNGYYQCLITSYGVEKVGEQNKLILELLPLDHWDITTSGKRKDLYQVLEYKGRFPLQYLFNFEEFYLPRGDKTQRIHRLVKAISGKVETVGDYFAMFEKMVGSQVIFRLIQKPTAKGRVYMTFEKDKDDILEVDKEDKLEPTNYNPEENNSVLSKGVSGEENWLKLCNREEALKLIKDSLFPNSDYIYLIPNNGAGGIENWLDKVKPTRKEKKDQQDKFIQYKFKLLDKAGLDIFYISKTKNEKFESINPKDLEERLEVFEKLGLKPVSKDWLWNAVKSKGSAYSLVDNYFKDNMPNLFLKREFPSETNKPSLNLNN